MSGTRLKKSINKSHPIRKQNILFSEQWKDSAKTEQHSFLATSNPLLRH